MKRLPLRLRKAIVAEWLSSRAPSITALAWRHNVTYDQVEDAIRCELRAMHGKRPLRWVSP